MPVLPDGKIIMIRQYRPAIGRETLELPAGARDPEDPDTAVTAARELEEETGYRCADLRFLASIDTAVAWCDENTDIYEADELIRAGEQHLDEAEEIRTEEWDAEELRRMIFSGEIRDAKTVAGLMAYTVRHFNEKKT